MAVHDVPSRSIASREKQRLTRRGWKAVAGGAQDAVTDGGQDAVNAAMRGITPARARLHPWWIGAARDQPSRRCRPEERA